MDADTFQAARWKHSVWLADLPGQIVRQGLRALIAVHGRVFDRGVHLEDLWLNGSSSA
jgi:hypothetical protein